MNKKSRLQNSNRDKGIVQCTMKRPDTISSKVRFFGIFAS